MQTPLANRLLMAIRQYTSATKAPSPLAVGKSVGCGEKAISRLFTCLRQKEASLGRNLNETVRLRGDVEVDGHALRTGRSWDEMLLVCLKHDGR